MTTGTPLVVRGAMKPLPTLTKPLRSVDLETHEPAAALRERTDSCTVPAAAVVAEAMVALVLAPAYREKLGGDHIDDARAALRRVRGADRMEALGAPGARCVFIGFMGAGKSSGARTVAAELGVQPLDSDRELEAELGETIEAFFDREGEQAFREREEATVLRLLDRAGGGAVALGGGSLQSERVREALDAHTVVHLEVAPEEAWRRAAGKGRPLARDRGRFDQLHADRAGLYESIAHATIPPAGREAVRRALPALRALHRARSAGATGLRMVWAPTRSRDYPVFFGRGAHGRRAHPPGGRPDVRRHRRQRGAPTTGSRPRTRVVDRRRARPTRRWPPPRACCGQLARAGRPRGRRGHRRRRRGGGRPGRPLRRALPARPAPRAGADHARGPGGLGLRRQDRRRPARGQELRRRLPPADRGGVRPGGAGHAAGGRAGGGLRRGGEDRPDRRRAAVGPRAGRRARGRGDDPGLPAHQAGRGGRGRARRGPAPGAEPGPHRGPRHRGRHRLLALPPRRGRGHRPAGRAAPVGPRGAARGGGRAAGRATGCR